MNELKLLSWPVVARAKFASGNENLPEQIVTIRPATMIAQLPWEIALLLPTYDGANATLNVLKSCTRSLDQAAAGLFLGDPFLNRGQLFEALRYLGIAWVFNLPSTTQHDDEILRYMDDVNLGLGREFGILAHLKTNGFKIGAVISRSQDVGLCLDLSPDAILVVPRVKDYTAGFPSANQRAKSLREISSVLAHGGWEGTLCGLVATSELRHEVLWPSSIHAAIAQPPPFRAILNKTESFS